MSFSVQTTVFSSAFAAVILSPDIFGSGFALAVAVLAAFVLAGLAGTAFLRTGFAFILVLALTTGFFSTFSSTLLSSTGWSSCVGGAAAAIGAAWLSTGLGSNQGTSAEPRSTTVVFSRGTIRGCLG